MNLISEDTVSKQDMIGQAMVFAEPFQFLPTLAHADDLQLCDAVESRDG